MKMARFESAVEFLSLMQQQQQQQRPFVAVCRGSVRYSKVHMVTMVQRSVALTYRSGLSLTVMALVVAALAVVDEQH